MTKTIASENIHLLENNNLSYNDILLEPAKGILRSREEASIESFKIFTAPMDTILDINNIEHINHSNLVKLLPREMTKQFISTLESNLLFKIRSSFYYCFGVSEDDLKSIVKLLKFVDPLGICIDVAHGHSEQALNMYKSIRAIYDGNIMSGSIATEWAAEDCINAGCNILRVGIGGGCFVPESLVHTINGFKEIQDIEINDLVLTHVGQYKKVLDKWAFQKNETLLQINDIVCTSNHEFFVIRKEDEYLINDDNYLNYGFFIDAATLSLLSDELLLVELD